MVGLLSEASTFFQEFDAFQEVFLAQDLRTSIRSIWINVVANLLVAVGVDECLHHGLSCGSSFQPHLVHVFRNMELTSRREIAEPSEFRVHPVPE